MDREIDYLTALLLDPFLTANEAQQEAATLAVTHRRSEQRRPADTHPRPQAPVLDF